MHCMYEVTYLLAISNTMFIVIAFENVKLILIYIKLN